MQKPNVVVLGAHGQLGQEFLRVLGPRAVGLGRSQLDLGDATALPSVLDVFQPQVVINAAACSQVDMAETDRPAALAANCHGPAALARLAAERGWQFVHFGTDYVFGADGLGRPRVETDPPVPVNFYGESKLLGERAVLGANSQALVLRVAHLFGGESLLTGAGPSAALPRVPLMLAPAWEPGAPSRGCASPGRANLVRRFIEQARAGQPICVTKGQTLNPTSVRDIVPATITLLDRRASGLFHLTGEGECTAAEFAAAVLRLAGLPGDIRRIERDTRPAKRPSYTVLENRRWNQAGFPPLPHWRAALTAYVADAFGPLSINGW